MAVATMTRLLDTSTTLGALTQTPIGTYGYAFELADQVHTVTALWTHNAAFSASATYQLQVDSPGTSGSVVVIDAMGNASTASYLNGALTVNSHRDADLRAIGERCGANAIAAHT